MNQRTLWAVCTIASISLLSQIAGGETYWVDAVRGDDNNSGTHQTMAFRTLSFAIEEGGDGDEIKVIGQSEEITVHRPLDWGTNTYFPLKKGLKIYGGYSVDDGEDHDYEIILSGDAGTALPPIPDPWVPYNTSWWNNIPSWSDNSIHVVKATDHTIDNETVLNGFTIQHGRGDDGVGIVGAGGGIYIQNCSPLISNCVFQYNRSGNGGAAYVLGGGVYDAEPTFEDCTFYRNYAFGGSSFAGGSGIRAGNGGAVYCARSSKNTKFIDCKFEENYAHRGGGAVSVRCDTQGTLYPAGSTMFYHCEFINNLTDNNGSDANESPGGGAVQLAGDVAATLDYCKFYGNEARCSDPSVTYTNAYGGAIWIGKHKREDYTSEPKNRAEANSPRIENCVFANNKSAGNGAAIYIKSDFDENSDGTFGNGGGPEIINCSFGGNTAEYYGGGLFGLVANGSTGYTPTIKNSVFWDNKDTENSGTYNTDETAQIHPGPSTTLSVLQSCVKGLAAFAGNNNIGDTPAEDNPNFPNLANSDIRLSGTTDCIDGGNNTYISADVNDYDNDGNTTETMPYDADFQEHSSQPLQMRIRGTVVDMGAYEYMQGDCNSNEIPDECDIACDSADATDPCNMYSACGGSNDCNSNDVPDECDIANSTSDDCNDNDIPDECDIANSTSEDCNANDVPDECDIANSTSEDCNSDGEPDECDVAECDVDGNGVPDDCGCLYDLDDSGFIGTGDENIIKANYGVCTSGPCKAYDLDCNDFIGTGDINIIKANYGVCVD